MRRRVVIQLITIGDKRPPWCMLLHVPSNKTQGVNLLSRNGNSQTGERMTQKRPRDGWILAHSMHALTRWIMYHYKEIWAPARTLLHAMHAAGLLHTAVV